MTMVSKTVFKKSPMAEFGRSAMAERAMAKVSLCAHARAIWPFWGFSELSGVDYDGAHYTPQWGGTWPVIYTKKTETWSTGESVVSTVASDFGYIGSDPVITTGMPPASGDYNSGGGSYTATTFTSSGSAGTYSILLEDPLVEADWASRTVSCLALLAANPLPAFPDTDYHIFGGWAGANIAKFFATGPVDYDLPPGTFAGGNEGWRYSGIAYFQSYGSTTSTASNKSYAPSYVSAASIGMPCYAGATSENYGPMTVESLCEQTGSDYPMALDPISGFQYGAIHCSKSSWKIYGGFDTSPYTVAAGEGDRINQNDHRTVSVNEVTFGNPFVSTGVSAPSPLSLGNSGTPYDYTQPLSFGQYTFEPDDVLANGVAEYGEMGFKAAVS